MYKAQSLKIEAAKGRLGKLQQDVQNVVQMNQMKLDTLERASKLLVEPSAALITLAGSYISSSSNISLASV
jgi:hypothetical protein